MAEKNDNDSLFSDIDTLLWKGIALETDILKASLIIRDQSKSAYKQQWLDARLTMTAIIRNLQEFKSGVPGECDPGASERLTLSVLYAQGMTVTETMISEGQYVKATACLKQDYEILTRMLEAKAGVAIGGKTPNVRHAPRGSQRFYGELNDVAHPSNLHLLQNLMGQLHSDDVHGLSSVPAFNETVAKNLYELHIWITFQIVREIIELATEMYGEDQAIFDAMRHLFVVAELLKKAGFEFSSADKPE